MSDTQDLDWKAQARFSVSARVLWVAVALVAAWAAGATYAALADVTIVAVTDAVVLKAAGVLGAFILFGYLVAKSEKLRWQERQFDAAFESGREGDARPVADA